MLEDNLEVWLLKIDGSDRWYTFGMLEAHDKYLTASYLTWLLWQFIKKNINIGYSQNYSIAAWYILKNHYDICVIMFYNAWKIW
jgi:hypothetical protein